ncbi:hypothetical protein [Olleya namhaensis]|uniref:hypothetical protein n=1 Tax=Olleya namhaensis TaxID=1144750 RepID=UPI002490DAE0|nr:hypothetical protein [Olleya namhaensis]
MKNTTYTKPDGLLQLEELQKDLLSAMINSDTLLSQAFLSNIINKLKLLSHIIDLKPRLPLFQIEEKIKETCKLDRSIQGVVVEILFAKKYGKIDRSKLAFLTIKV